MEITSFNFSESRKISIFSLIIPILNFECALYFRIRQLLVSCYSTYFMRMNRYVKTTMLWEYNVLRVMRLTTISAYANMLWRAVSREIWDGIQSIMYGVPPYKEFNFIQRITIQIILASGLFFFFLIFRKKKILPSPHSDEKKTQKQNRHRLGAKKCTFTPTYYIHLGNLMICPLSYWHSQTNFVTKRRKKWK